MKISTKGRYALRVMVDLALNYKEGFVSLNDIAKRQEISNKYLEQIVSLLNKAGFLKVLFRLFKVRRLLILVELVIIGLFMF